ncbi:hypothetical protein N9Y42_08405 [Mariniblastus sp.]|nr:hypothetical protein [Mariniblastus sp.]
MFSKRTFHAIARLLLYAIPVIASALVIKRDAGIIADGMKFGENSGTELMQQSLLLMTSFTFFIVGFTSQSHKAIGALFGAGFMVLMYRELDAHLDEMFHGAWFFFAILIAGVMVALVIRQKKQIWENLDEFYSTYAFGIFLSGLMSVLVFSRIFGAKTVWRALFDVEKLETKQRWAKNAVEEGSELFGYSLLFIAAVEFLVHVVQQRRLADKPSD